MSTAGNEDDDRELVPPRRGRLARAGTGPARRARRAEILSGVAIRVGGIGTILSVALIFVFLIGVVTPLFLGATAKERALPKFEGLAGASSDPVLAAGVDERKEIAWALGADGMLDAWSLADGARLERRPAFASANDASIATRPTAFSAAPGEASFCAGFDDGTVRFGRVRFSNELVARTSPTGDEHARATSIAFEAGEPIRVAEGAESVLAVDRSSSSSRDALLALTAAGELVLVDLARNENLLTGEVTWETKTHRIAFERGPDGTLPVRVLLDANASTGYLAWDDGRLLRYDLRDPEHAVLAQNVELATSGARLTALAFLIGKTTLVAGDSAGAVSAWFPTKPRHASTRDGVELVRAHELASRGPAIRALAASGRGRVLAALDASATLRLWNVTNERELLALHLPRDVDASSVGAIALAPREDGVFASGARSALWDADLRHPEAGFAALFGAVWYEGAEKPEHVWQSTSGTDAFEPKLGLVPLVFGTVKATFYSMAFAVPIALLAALYTSQFLSARVRAPLKSAIEMMASLPSVVLGFLAGVVVAPFAEQVVPAILVGAFTVPFALCLGAHVVQLLPERVAIRIDGPARLAATAVAIAAGVLLAVAIAPVAERALFAGDLSAWLDRRAGTALGGWILLLLPFAAAVTAFFVARVIEPASRERSALRTRSANARSRLVVFALGTVAAIGIAALAGLALQSLGLDARGGVLDTYVQRNSLIVGVMMGFAVIPIVFTIADDALAAVPAHLKLASIGAGATPWQTAVRVVLPTAASGIFSAIMVGLGRAVGETMIVLMAAGNTPILSWNVFDGFRTLSANIATEMPEAVRGSTHFRTLFLAAVCLFAITFALNTVAELVRQRYRRRAARL